MTSVIAIDLGASSGRVMRAEVQPGSISLSEVHRFPNGPVDRDGSLRWDLTRIRTGVMDGLRKAAAIGPIDSIGIDSWAVDYGLVTADGRLVDDPFHYRDSRVDSVVANVDRIVPADELYAITGLQHLAFNTIYQLAADLDTNRLADAATLLLIPDLVTWWLTDQIGAEVTNASTTQLYDVRTRTWALDIIDRLGLPRRLFPALRNPGDRSGVLSQAVRTELGISAEVPVIAVGSHDTASAIVGVPADGKAFAYISCGTWSLVGVELDHPVLTEESLAANFTNEAGVDGTIRYLRNVMGLWLLQECQRVWSEAGLPHDVETLVAEATHTPKGAVFDPDDPAFLAPGDMPSRIVEACEGLGQPIPTTQAGFVRAILDSLAAAHDRTVREAQRLSGHRVNTIHLVGGGARNALLCQLTADACGLPVIAGPVEAAALGNVLIQARSLGAAPETLDGLRTLLRGTQTLVTYHPASGDVPYATRRGSYDQMG